MQKYKNYITKNENGLYNRLTLNIKLRLIQK